MLLTFWSDGSLPALPNIPHEPRTDHPPTATRLGGPLNRWTTIGASLQLTQVLDVIEGLLVASQHPDIVLIRRYGKDATPGGNSPAGVCVKHCSGSEAYIWGAVHPGEIPIPVPEVLPAPERRADRLAVLVTQLLDVARPEQFRSWQLVAFPDLGPVEEQGKSAAGISLVCADGTKVMLRTTAGSGQTGDPAEEPAPGYVLPEAVSSWHLEASALFAAHR